MSNDQIVAGNIPQEPPGYQPRTDLLAKLDGEVAGAPTIHMLTGPTGTGKTQLAAAYARAKLAAGWRLVAWVDAGTLLAGLAASADAAGVPDDGHGCDTAAAGRAVRHRLETDGDRCLLVLDGAEDPDALQPFLPVVGAARVLVTTTHPAAADLGTEVPVGPVTPEQARAFLAGRTGAADNEEAATVAAELGHLPLALAAAAAVIAGPSGYQAYLDRLRAMPAGDDDLGPPGVVKAVLLALDSLREADGTGLCARLIEIMAVLSPAGVPRELLHVAGRAGALGPGGRQVAPAVIDHALAELAERSLLTSSLDDQTVVLHGLVAGVARSRLGGREQLTACRSAAALLERRVHGLGASPKRQAVRDIPEQVSALLGHAARPPAGSDEALTSALLRIRFLALYHLIELGDSATQAIAIGEPLVADLERTLGPDRPDTLNARNSLAAAYQGAGRPAEAVPLFERTLVDRERLLGPNDPDTLNSQNNLAATYQDVGRISEAILLFRLTLAARERLLGPGHPSTLNSRGNLAAAYRAAGRTAEAIPLLEQTLAGRERVLGAGHPDTEASRKNLDDARQEADRPAATVPPADLLPVGLHPARQLTAEPPLVEPPVVEPPVVEQTRPVGQSQLPAEPVRNPVPASAGPPVPSPADDAPSRPLEDAAPPAALQPPVPELEPETPAAAADQTTEEEIPEEPQNDTPLEPPPPLEPGIPRWEPSAGSPRPPVDLPARRRVRVLSVAAALVILLAAGGGAIAVFQLHSSGHGAVGHGQPPHARADPAQMAAVWVSQEVSHNVTVACDPRMCSALEARGVSAARLLVLQASTPSPRGAELVVATPTVRSQFGTRLNTVYAPSVIAGFGSGSGQVNVQVVAPDGAAAYLTALRQDVGTRKAAGAQLVANRHIAMTAQVRRQLAAGDVDSRLLIMLPALAATHPIQVLAFGDSGPWASPGVPLSSADLSGSGKTAGLTDADYLQWLTSFVRAQLVPFAGSVVVVRQGDQSILRVVFARPSPLGLLAHG